VGGSTLSETRSSDKTASLDPVRVDAAGQVLTTNFGAPVPDNQTSLKAGLRGPTLMEDFILREKITHFDHERIPERIVHARGSAAHGFFECYEPQTKLTRAAFLSAKGKRTPVFVRFSTVAGERGSSDLARDVRGFATKFYTEEGNFDLVGNNIPGVLHPGRDEVSGPGARGSNPSRTTRCRRRRAPTTRSGTSSRSCPSRPTC
jgi:catalase